MEYLSRPKDVYFAHMLNLNLRETSKYVKLELETADIAKHRSQDRWKIEEAYCNHCIPGLLSFPAKEFVSKLKWPKIMSGRM